jgi:large subunit ribosomal protein L15
MNLANIKPAKGATKERKRIGRGEGSGSGVTAGRGHKGYGSRSGAKRRAWFEGGQMPLQRRLPKFGFTNIHRKDYQVVNVGSLCKIKAKSEITKDILYQHGLIRKKSLPVKILGNGKLESKITITIDAVSKSAKEKIEKMGGSVTIL